MDQPASSTRRGWRWGASLVLLLGGVAACSAEDPSTTETTNAVGASTTTEAAPADDLTGTISVFAAASLTDAFGELAENFQEAHPGVTVTLNFAGSAGLRDQILAGAPADVFAAASPSTMQGVVDGGEAASPETFVTNELEIVVPADNPGSVDALDDFANQDLLIGLCAAEVPCGQFGLEVLANAGITPSVDTNEPDVRSLLTKVTSGDLDAGLVYHTDVIAAGDDVVGIAVPDEDNFIAKYPIVSLTNAPNATGAAAFVDYVLSPAGQTVLQSYGFMAP